MAFAGFMFYIFAAITVACGVMVITSRNPVHSVLFLILAFFNAAGLFVLIGAEFLAMILVVVYVGAVAVLFLFVVMMLDVDFVELKQGTLRYWPFALLVGIIFLGELALVWAASGQLTFDSYDPSPGAATNAEAIGGVRAAGVGFQRQVIHRPGPAQLLEVRLGGGAVQVPEVNVGHAQRRVAAMAASSSHAERNYNPRKEGKSRKIKVPKLCIFDNR